MSQGDNPFVITPPPGGVPAPQPAPAAAAPVLDSDGFISLPPGLADLDSGTRKLSPPRAPSRPKVTDDEPVFFTLGAPGMPVAPPVVTELEEETRIAPSRAAASEWRLVLPDGRQLELATTTLLGRDPAPSALFPAAQRLPLLDPAKSVSKTHAVLELAADGQLWVHDLGSTNGVYFSYANGQEADVEPGRRAPVESGTNLHLGDFVIRINRG